MEGKAAIVTVTLRNQSAVTVTSDRLPPYDNAIVLIKYLHAGVEEDVPLTDFGRRYFPTFPPQGAGRISESPLKPGESITVNIDLSQIYKLTAKGTYQLVIQLGINDLHEDAFSLKNPPIEFTVS